MQDRHTAAPHLLTTSQAAKILGFTPRALEERRRRGGGPTYIRLGGSSVRYDLADLKSWIAERKFKSTSEETVEAGR